MAYSPETRQKLRNAFVHQGLSLEAACEQVGVAFGTGSRWKRDAASHDDDWEKARTARYLSQQGSDVVTQVVLEEFITLFQTTITKIKEEDAPGLRKAEAISRLSDAYNKTMSAARKGSPEVNKLAVAMDVIAMLSDFVGKHFPKHAPAFIDILEPFGEHLSQHLS